MESKEIYVVVATWTIEFECGQKVRLFSTLEKAQKYMKDDIEMAKSSCPNFTENNIGELSAYISEEGNYSENHCEWNIEIEMLDRMDF